MKKGGGAGGWVWGGVGWGRGGGGMQMSKIVHTRPAQLTQSPLFAIQPWDQNSKEHTAGIKLRPTSAIRSF